MIIIHWQQKKRPSGISSIKLLWHGFSHGETLPLMCQPVKGKTENSGAIPTENVKNPVISSFIFWWSHIFISGKFSMSFNLLMILSSTLTTVTWWHSTHSKVWGSYYAHPWLWARDGNFPLLGMVLSLEGTQVSLLSQDAIVSIVLSCLAQLIRNFSLPSTHNTEGQYILQPGHKSSHCRKLTPGMRCHR